MYLAIDTETTGLNADCQVLTAYFIVLDNDLHEMAHLDLKIRYPYYKVYTKALEVNRIDLIKHDREAIDFVDAKNVLNKFLNDHKTPFRYIPLGHNINFDLKMLKNSGLLSDDHLSPNVLDTITIAQFLKTCKIIPNKQSLSLTNLAKHFNLTTNNKTANIDFHTAEYDIRMTVELLKQLKDVVVNDVVLKDGTSSGVKRKRELQN